MRVSSDLNKNSKCWKPGILRVCKDGSESDSDDDDGNFYDNDGDCRHWMHWIPRTSLRFVCSLSHQSSFRLSWRQSVFFSTDRKQMMISLSNLISPSFLNLLPMICAIQNRKLNSVLVRSSTENCFLIFSLHNSKIFSPRALSDLFCI